MNQFSITFRGFISERVDDKELLYAIRDALNLELASETLDKEIILDNLTVTSGDIIWEEKP